MRSWPKMLILFSILSAVALLGPASALATGPSAGDQQYVDPLGASNPSSGSHHSSGNSHSSGSGTTSTQPAPSTTTPAATTPTPTATTPTATTPTATTPTATTPTATTPTATTANSTTPGAAQTRSVDPSKTLPYTGFDAWLGAILGLGMLASGLSLRRAARGA